MVDARFLTKTADSACGDYGLICKNGATCTHGAGDVLHKHLGSISHITAGIENNKYHCECGEGFIGHDCSVKVTECVAQRSDLVHSCYYGSTCIEMDNEYGLLDRYCDCSTADVGQGILLAGLMCQYKSTSICVSQINFMDMVDQFCVNGGKCKAMVDTDDKHPGCICDEEEWEGKHCEFVKGTLFDDALDLFQQRQAEIANNNYRGVFDVAWANPEPLDESEVSTQTISGNRLYIIIGGVTALSGIVLLLILSIRKSRKEQQRSDKMTLMKETIGLDSTRRLPPPVNVFLASRKTEIETDDDVSLMMQECNERNVPESDEEMVEMLDTETSIMLEAQFSHQEMMFNSSSKVSQDDKRIDKPYYDDEDENIDGDCELLTTGRITANSGLYPLIDVLSKKEVTRDLVGYDENRAETNSEDCLAPVLGAIRSMDGEDGQFA